jgi:predicted amidohydrolase
LPQRDADIGHLSTTKGESMARFLNLAAGQLGPIARDEPRSSVVKRLIALLDEAKSRGIELVVFPEMALTTFFPRWYIEDWDEVDRFFEREMPSRETRPLFEAAARLGIGFYLGYCELTEEGGKKRRYNTSILVERDGRIVGKYRKIHVPGSAVNNPAMPFQHLEQLYFSDGNLGFPVWEGFGGTMGMAICNDRRWPETYRVMALKGTDLVMLGFNTPAQLPDWPVPPSRLHAGGGLPERALGRRHRQGRARGRRRHAGP